MANFKYLSHDAKVKLFKSHCCVMYGSQAWDLSMRTTALCELEATWHRSARAVLGLPWRTRSCLVPLLLNQEDLLTELRNRFAKMVKSALSNGNSLLAHLVDCASLNPDLHVSIIGRNLRSLNSTMEAPSPEDVAVADAVTELLNVRDNQQDNPFFHDFDIEAFGEMLCTDFFFPLLFLLFHIFFAFLF